MLPDLPTLLLVRLGLDVLIAVAFWWQMRRYPAIGGPGWWSLSGVLSIAGSAVLLWRLSSEGPLLAGLALVLLFGSHACGWLGLRRYLQLPMPWRVLAGMLVTLVSLLVVLAAAGPSALHVQLVYLLVMGAMALCVLYDLLGLRSQRSQPEYRVLAAVTASELVALTAMSAWLLWGGQALDSVAARFMLFFLLSKFLRVLVFSALVSLRLRQEVEQTRLGMAEREAESRALVDNLGAGVLVLGPDRSVARINAAARRFLAWPEGGRPPAPGAWPLLGTDGQRLPRHEMPFERVLATGLPVSDVVVGIHIAGEIRWALCNAYPENDALGGLRHVVFTFVDITAMRQMQQHQRALEQQLAQSQKMEALGTLAGGVAHDFNNILAAILGNADLARQDLAPGAPSRQSLHEISTAARRGRELVRQILAFSRQQPLARAPVCPAAIVAETCSLLRTAIGPHVQLVKTVAPHGQAIVADPTRLGQVLLNLGTNAVHALQGRPGRVEFRTDTIAADDPALPEVVAHQCRRSGLDAVRIAVQDDGCGMDEATRARIFEPFFTTKGVGQGTGLGLPVVLGIVEAHGGAIAVDSRPGAGTTFTLFFPASREQPDHPAADDGTIAEITNGAPTAPDNVNAVESPAMSDQPSAETRHILYLDDDDTLVFLVRRLLERRGYKVTAVCDQQEAIDAVRAQPQGFHLLMTDYNMPGMSGIDVAREVLSINPALPVAVASGYISDELQAEAAAAGVAEVVFKTDAVEAFCEVVARLVR
jgi:two-component system cell cycle sensor histidine kinase/response regulator CckA